MENYKSGKLGKWKGGKGEKGKSGKGEIRKVENRKRGKLDF